MSRIVRSYLQKFSSNIEKVPEHYQLHGTFATHLNENALKLHQKLLVRCDDNAYEPGVALKSIVSSAIIPDKARDDISNMAKLGEKRYKEFVNERLLVTSEKSLWDKITKLKLKMSSNWMEKSKFTVGDKVIKLREERQLFARFLIIQQSRPDKIMKIDIRQRVETLGVPKSQGLIRIHNFSRADWGGKFVRISKKTWVQTYLSLDDDDIV